MKKSTIAGTLISGAVLGALAVGSALAADMPVKAPMLMKAPAPVYNWTGCYIGGGAGYGMWNQNNTFETDPGHVAITAQTTAGGKGWFGTATAGCDYQVSSSIVIGAYGDWDFGDIKGNPTGFTFVGSESEKWAWDAAARIGWLVSPTFLTYVSGGYTQAHFDQVSITSLFPPFTDAGFNAPAQTYSGWFLGSGFDYAVSILPQGFFLRTEYKYASYQSEDVPFVSNASGLSIGFATNTQKFVQSVRTDLIYRFNWH